MIGAQFLLAMRARSSLRALSISLRYAASTTGAAMGLNTLEPLLLVNTEPNGRDRARGSVVVGAYLSR